MESEFTADELLDRGVRLLESRHHMDALRNLKRCYAMDPGSTRCLSYLGLALALAEKRYREGEELCQLAIRKEFFHAAFYHNLGRVYLAAGQKKRAIWAFRKGLEVDRTDARLRTELVRMGERARPLVRFLPRGHIVNRTLGQLRRSILPRGTSAPAEGAEAAAASRRAPAPEP